MRSLHHPIVTVTVGLTVTALVAGCGSSGSSSSTTAPGTGSQSSKIDDQLRAVINQLGLTGDPTTGRTLPDINDPLAQLGKRLFFTQSLGGQFDSSCASCHLPALGGGDDMSLSIGVDAIDPHVLGPGRLHEQGSVGWEGDPTVPRNAPTTFNIGLWDSGLFWDSRVESLDKTPGLNGGGAGGIRTPDTAFGVADPYGGDNLPTAQSRFPVTSAEEMRGFNFEVGGTNEEVRDHLEARLGNYGIGAGEISEDWLPHFRDGFEDPLGTAQDLVTYENIATAIGEYERSQVFVDTPWKAYVQGNRKAISKMAKRGALIFFRDPADGGAGCYQCHSGDFFTDEQHYVLAVPQIGRGKGDGRSEAHDFGRVRETGDPVDKFAFRTPTLLNVSATGPWGHDGAYTTLEGIVRHHLDPASAVVNYDIAQLDPTIKLKYAFENSFIALGRIRWLRENGLKTVEDVALTDKQVAELLEFLETLTDPCVLDPNCLEPWMQRDDGFDSHLLIPKDGNGTPF